jgi:hypothetical protein
MSVYHQSLVLYGWEIGTDQYKEYDEDDGWENELEQEFGWRDQSEGDVAVVYDGRGGRYCYFGMVVAATNSTRDGPQNFGNQYALDCSLEPDDLDELAEACQQYEFETGRPPQFHVFTHVT